MKNRPSFPIPSTANGGESFSVPLEAFLPLLVPGFRCIWQTSFNWDAGSRKISAISSLSRGNKIYRVWFSQVQRGVYKGKSGTIFIEDLFGFTRFIIYSGEEISLIVFPRFEKNGSCKEKNITGGDIATVDENRIRSNELLEVRKYYPGDDARRINWKMFAASGQLFLRIGEEIPPTSGEVTVILNCESRGMTRLNDSTYYTDCLISTFLTFINSFVEKGCKVSVILPSIRGQLDYDREKPDKLLAKLAELTSKSVLKNLENIDYCYLVSHPDSPFFNYLIENYHGEIRVFIKTLPEIKRPSMIKHIIFQNSSVRSNYIELKNSLLLKEEAMSNVTYLNKNGKGRIHAEII